MANRMNYQRKRIERIYVIGVLINSRRVRYQQLKYLKSKNQMEEMAEIDTEKEHTHLSKCTEGQDERDRERQITHTITCSATYTNKTHESAHGDIFT